MRLQYFPRQPYCLKHVWNVPSHKLLQTNDCIPNSRKNAMVCRPPRTITSHELLHELVTTSATETTIEATPLAESTPSPNSEVGTRYLEKHRAREPRNLTPRACPLVAQCSATPATVAATPPSSATPFQTQISVRHLPAQGGGGATPKFLGGVSRVRKGGRRQGGPRHKLS